MERHFTRIQTLLAVIAATIVWICATGIVHADSPRPVIHVQFEIDGDSFDALDLTEVRRSVTGQVAKAAGSRFGFLDWVADEPSAASAAPAAQWTVRLEIQPHSVTMGDEVIPGRIVRLHHYAGIDGQQLRLPQAGDREILYDWGSPLPETSADKLGEDLRKKLDEQLDALLQGRDMENALFKIRIGDTLLADLGQRRILIPLRLRDLRAENNALFRVVLVPEGSTREDFTLREDGEVREPGEHEGFITAEVTEWSVSSVSANTPAPWIDELPALLAGFDHAYIFLREYTPSLAGASETVDGVLLDPGF